MAHFLQPIRAGAAAFILAGLCTLAAGQATLPRPQIASAAGKPAPDFSLQDQAGKPFQLSAAHGKRILLVFYRGYW